MAHFAELDNDNKVIRVLVTDNDALEGDEGYTWLVNTFGGTWAKTSYNGNFGGKFAGPGDTWDGNEFIAAPVEETELFVPPTE